MQVFLQICTNDGKLTYRGYDKYELWTCRSQDHSLPGTFATWNFRSHQTNVGLAKQVAKQVAIVLRTSALITSRDVLSFRDPFAVTVP